MIKHRAVPLLFLVLFVAACDQKKDGITSSNTMAISVDPATPQTVTAGSRIPLKAAFTGSAVSADVSPAWSVENSLGTFEPAQGKETTFIAGSAAGTGKIYATYGSVRGETTVTVGCPGNTGGTTGSGGSTGGCDNLGPTFGLFSETYIAPGLLLDTDSSRFRNGGCLGVWPDGERTVLCAGTQQGEMSEGLQSLKCTVGTSGGWWLQFGSDDVPGLSEDDVMKAKDMSSFAGGTLKFDVKTTKDVLIALKWGEGNPLPNAYYTLRELGVPHDGQWHSVSIPLSRFSGLDLKQVKIPASFSAAPGCIDFTYYVDNVRWEK
jgi:hypothetical protein